jgi:hypothetical protein
MSGPVCGGDIDKSCGRKEDTVLGFNARSGRGVEEYER